MAPRGLPRRRRPGRASSKREERKDESCRWIRMPDERLIDSVRGPPRDPAGYCEANAMNEQPQQNCNRQDEPADQRMSLQFTRSSSMFPSVQCDLCWRMGRQWRIHASQPEHRSWLHDSSRQIRNWEKSTISFLRIRPGLFVTWSSRLAPGWISGGSCSPRRCWGSRTGRREHFPCR